MRKSRKNNWIKRVFLIFGVGFFIGCNSHSQSGNVQKNVDWNLDSCYFVKVAEDSKCIDCESSLEFFVTIKNNTESDFYIHQFDRRDSLKKGAIQIINNGVSYESKHEIVDSLLVKKGTSFVLVIQPDIYMVQLKDFTKGKYDDFIKKMAEKAEIQYRENELVTPIDKSSKYKIIDRLH